MMPAHAQLDDRSAAALKHVLDLTERHGGMIAHDLSDPLDAAYLEWLARGGGMTPERYPCQFGMIAPRPDGPPVNRPLTVEDLPGQNEGEFASNQIVDFIGALESGPYSGRAKGHATLTRTKEIESASVSLLVVNYSGTETTVVARGSETGFNTQTLRVETDDTTALQMPAKGQNAGLVTWWIRYTDKTTEASTQSTQWSSQAAADPVVAQPVQNAQRVSNKVGDLTAIVVGLSRGFNKPGQNSDVDYWFWQNEWSKIELLIPLVGSMKFEHPLAPLNENNPILEFYLARQEGGMSNKPVKEAKRYRQKFSIDPSDSTKLNFALEATATGEGTALNFGSSPWVSDTRTFFTCRVTAAFQNQQFGAGMASIVSSEEPDKDPTDGVTCIKPLVFVWHCLVEGTQITMADGTTKAVEKVEAQDEVRTGGGTTRKVLATLAQPHWGEVCVVNLASGKTVTCSEGHAFVTPNGPVAASSLAVGQSVEVDGGLDTVASVTKQTQTGQGLFNLWLDPTGGGSTTMLANGIWVGDYQMQVELLERASRDPELARARLSEEMLPDYESFLEDNGVATSA